MENGPSSQLVHGHNRLLKYFDPAVDNVVNAIKKIKVPVRKKSGAPTSHVELSYLVKIGEGVIPFHVGVLHPRSGNVRYFIDVTVPREEMDVFLEDIGSFFRSYLRHNSEKGAWVRKNMGLYETDEFSPDVVRMERSIRPTLVREDTLVNRVRDDFFSFIQASIGTHNRYK